MWGLKGALMTEPFDAIRNFDRLVHDPSRLVILSALDACRKSDFKFLQSVTGLSKGNLSLHLAKLEAHGLVAIEKKARLRRTVTWVKLTPEGRTTIRAHWRRLEESRRAVSKWAERFRLLEPDPEPA